MVDPGYRLLTSQADRDRWQHLVGNVQGMRSMGDLLAHHPRRRILVSGFNVASYLARYEDIRHFIHSPLHVVTHFLEFGCEEGRTPHPGDVDWAFVQDLYANDLATAPVEKGGASVLDVIIGHLQAHHGEPFARLVFLSLEEMLAATSVASARISEIFDYEYYRAVYLDEACARWTWTACFEHFCRVGQFAGCDPSPDWALDESFYDAQYGLPAEAFAGPAAVPPRDGFLKPRPVTPARRAAVRHWVCKGVAEGEFPNLAAWAAETFGVQLASSLERQAIGMCRSDPGDNVAVKPTDAIRQLVEQPLRTMGRFALPDSASARTLTVIADRHATSGNARTAEAVYQHIVENVPDVWKAVQHKADLLLRLGRPALAGQEYDKLIAAGAADRWTILNAAEAALALEDHEKLRSLLEDGVAAIPDDVRLGRDARLLLSRSFESLWSRAAETARARGIGAAQDQVRTAARAATPPIHRVASSRPIRSVAIVGDCSIPQCRRYRMVQKKEQLTAADIHTELFDGHHEIESFKQSVHRFDAAIFYRLPAFPAVTEAIAAAAACGLATIYEMDDLVFDTDHFPLAYESYAGLVSLEDYRAMACGVPLFAHAMSLCDYGIASTPTLQALMQPVVRTGRVFLHRNALDSGHYAAIERALGAVGRNRFPRPQGSPARAGRACTIVYASGTRAHKSDFRSILEPALVTVAQRFKEDVRILLIGDFPPGGPLTVLPNVEVRPVVPDFDAFLSIVAAADINLSVLADGLAADAKSEIKWLEAAIFGVPSVVSDTATHRDVIEDGETGYLARSAAEFEERISELVRSPGLRMRIGEAARAFATARYAIEPMGANISGILDVIRPGGAHRRREKLLVVNVFYPPNARGGATRVVHDSVRAIRALAGDEFEIDVACCVDDGGEPFTVRHYAHEGVRVFAISAPPADWLVPHHPPMAEAFARVLDASRPALVHFHCVQLLTASVVEAAALRGIPYVLTVHDGWWISPHQFIVGPDGCSETYDFSRWPPVVSGRDEPDPRALRLRDPLFGAERVLAVSDSFAELYRSAGVSRVVAMENGVDLLSPKPRQPTTGGRVRLAHVGGTECHKGLHLVRSALRAHPFENLSLTVVEHGMDRHERREDVWGTTPVTVRGPVPQAEVADLYAGVDVLLAPSVWPESFGLVTREALQCGCRVVASDRGAVALCVEEGVNGHVVPVDDHLDLMRVLQRIDAAPQAYRSPPRGAFAPRTAREQADELLQLYRELTAFEA